jgi:hypothetical protein
MLARLPPQDLQPALDALPLDSNDAITLMNHQEHQWGAGGACRRPPS